MCNLAPSSISRYQDRLGTQCEYTPLVGGSQACLTSHLRRPRPPDKRLGDPLARPPPAKELSQRRRGEAVRRNRRKEGEHGLALAEVDVRHFLEEPGVPAASGPVELFLLAVREKERQLESLGEAHEVEFSSGRQRLSDVPAIEARLAPTGVKAWTEWNRERVDVEKRLSSPCEPSRAASSAALHREAVSGHAGTSEFLDTYTHVMPLEEVSADLYRELIAA